MQRRRPSRTRVGKPAERMALLMRFLCPVIDFKGENNRLLYFDVGAEYLYVMAFS